MNRIDEFIESLLGTQGGEERCRHCGQPIRQVWVHARVGDFTRCPESAAPSTETEEEILAFVRENFTQDTV